MYSLLRGSLYLLLNTLLCNSQTPFIGRKLVFQNSKIGLENIFDWKSHAFCSVISHAKFGSAVTTLLRNKQTLTNYIIKLIAWESSFACFFFYNSHSRLNPMKVLVVLPHIGPIIAWSGTTCIVYVFSRTLQSGLPSIESTHHVLCNKCSLAWLQWPNSTIWDQSVRTFTSYDRASKQTDSSETDR